MSTHVGLQEFNQKVNSGECPACGGDSKETMENGNTVHFCKRSQSYIYSHLSPCGIAFHTSSNPAYEKVFCPNCGEHV